MRICDNCESKNDVQTICCGISVYIPEIHIRPTMYLDNVDLCGECRKSLIVAITGYKRKEE